MTIVFKKRDRDYAGYTPYKKPVYKLVQRKPKGTFEADGYKFELYPVSILAEALDRKKRTLIQWEELGLFPRPMFDLPSAHYTRKDGITIKPRWYSGDQIMNLHNIMFIKYGGTKGLKDDLLKQFFKDVKKAFYQRRLLTEKEIKS